MLWKPLLRLLLVMLLATPLVVPPAGGGGGAAAAPTPAPDYHHQLSPPWQLCVPAFPPTSLKTRPQGLHGFSTHFLPKDRWVLMQVS